MRAVTLRCYLKLIPLGRVLLPAQTIASQFFIRFRAILFIITSLGFNCGLEFEKGSNYCDLHAQ